MDKVSEVAVKTAVLLILLLYAVNGSAAGIWQDIDPVPPAHRGNKAEPVYYRALRADADALKQALAAAPLEFTSSQGAELSLPMPDGSMQRFEVENSPIMAPELAARYPEIQTYRVRGIDDRAVTGRLDMTPKGFHAMLTTSSGTLFIDPDETGAYRSYTKQAYAWAKGLAEEQTGPTCLVEGESEIAARPAEEVALRTSRQRRVYRLAVAATGEYTQFHGGTVPEAHDAIVTAINRVNQIYGRDVAIQFELVANNDSIIFTDPATDPYEDLSINYTITDLISENQKQTDTIIGSPNYDIGHLFSTIDGGLATVGSTCVSDIKAKATTGLQRPIGEAFYIDLVSHEVGHQLDADHTFNGTTGACQGGRVAASAVEPGSGSTIMSYAGICDQEDLQSSSDATFHAWSIRQIVDYSSSASCGAILSTANTAPLNSSTGAFTIPANTPFALVGSASDAEGDVLSYQWDQMDAKGTPTTAFTLGSDLGSNPLFRSFLPQDTPLRIFPRLSSLLTSTTDIGETLPTTTRVLNFRLTVRDGQSGVDEDDVVVTVDNTKGPFKIREPVDSGLVSGQRLPISWDSADTDLSPINCATVDIHLLTFSSDESSYCEHELASGVSNIAKFNQPILPNQGTTKGRIRVRCSNNIFFDINDSDIIVDASNTAATDCVSTDGDALEHGAAFNDEGTIVEGSDGGGGGGGALLLLPALLGFRVFGRLLKLESPFSV